MIKMLLHLLVKTEPQSVDRTNQMQTERRQDFVKSKGKQRNLISGCQSHQFVKNLSLCHEYQKAKSGIHLQQRGVAQRIKSLRCNNAHNWTSSCSFP